MVIFEQYPAVYKHTDTVSGSSRHFCTPPCNATSWRSQSQVNTWLHQASLGPPICFPELCKVRGAWLKSDLSGDPSGFYCRSVTVLLIAGPQKMVSGQPKPSSSAGFCLGGCWPDGLQGSYSGKHTKPELIQKSKMATTGTRDA